MTGGGGDGLDVGEAFARAGERSPDPESEAAKAAVKAALLGGHALAPRIGRYEVLGALARGGMGIVLRARDPELHREVALKLVAPSRAGDPAREQARLLREGRALARLTHPHVVTVFDVGVHAPGPGREPMVYLAMELLEGCTLRAWLCDRARDRSAVLGVMRQAARGLAAAHAAGLVHRDFKPDNMIIDAVGHARIVDFGLAVPHGDTDDASSEPSRRTSGSVTTRAGTPQYAAPELLRGEPITPAADQFAFCVTLHEALVGHRPRVGDPALSGALGRVVARGLAPDPADRHRDMLALGSALDRAARGGARRRLSSAIAIAGALAGLAIAAPMLGRDRGSIMIDARAFGARLDARILLHRARQADDAHDFDEAEALGHAALQAAAAVGDAQAELDAALLLVHVVAWGQLRLDDATRILRAADAIVTRIGDDPARRSEWLAASGSVAHGRGRWADAVESYAAAIALRDEAGADPRPAWWQALGVSQYRLGRLDDALASQARAYEGLVALRGADHPDVAAVLVSRAQVLKQVDRLGEGRRDYARAIEILQAHHGADHRALAIPLLDFGNLERAAGDMARAAELHARYRAIVADAFAPDHPEQGRALVTLAEERILAGDFDAAVTAASSAVDIAAAELGEGHTRVAYALGLEGQALLQRGDTRSALARFDRAVRSAEATHAADDPQIAYYLLLRCDAQLALGERQAARAGHERAAALLAASPAGHAPIREHLAQVGDALHDAAPT